MLFGGSHREYNPLLCIYKKIENRHLNKELHADVYTSTIYNTPSVLSHHAWINKMKHMFAMDCYSLRKQNR